MHKSRRAKVSAQFSPKCTIGNAQLNRGKSPLRHSDYIPSLQYWLPLIAREWVTNCSHPWYFARGGKQIQHNTAFCISSFSTPAMTLIYYYQNIILYVWIDHERGIHSYEICLSFHIYSCARFRHFSDISSCPLLPLTAACLLRKWASRGRSLRELLPGEGLTRHTDLCFYQKGERHAVWGKAGICNARFKRTLLSANTFMEKIDTGQIHSHGLAAGNSLKCYEKLYVLFESFCGKYDC